MIKLETTLNQLNEMFHELGTWQSVADSTGFNRATINKWFAGTRVPSDCSRWLIDRAHSFTCGWPK